MEWIKGIKRGNNMKFTIDAKEFEKALTDVLLKGKYVIGVGLSNSSLDDYFYAQLKENTLSIWNVDTISSLIVNTRLTVDGDKDGAFVGYAKTLLPYLKDFTGEVEIDSGDIITMKNINSKVSQPVIVHHPNMDGISRVRDMVREVRYEETLDKLWNFGKNKYEGAFQLPSNTFNDTMKLAELVGEGVYHLNYKHDESKLLFSSSTNNNNRFETSIDLEGNIGESATLDFSGPLHNFFDKDTMLNFYVKDDFPILIMSDNKLLVKAPNITN